VLDASKSKAALVFEDYLLAAVTVDKLDADTDTPVADTEFRI
jgi:hypothetical protein